MTMTLYRNAARDNVAAIIAVLQRDAGTPAPNVPSCPDWTVTDLVLHLGAVHRHAAKVVANHEREQVPITPADLGWLDLPQPFLHWLMSEHAPTGEPLPPQVVTWFEHGAQRLDEAVYGADPDEPVWTWSPDRRVAHYQRMMAIETAVHRWDLQHAYGVGGPIDAALAHDGIDHTFDVMLPARRSWSTPRAGSGERYHFHRTDGPGEWTLRFDGDDVAITREHAHAGVTLSGTASDLFLFLWGRLPAHALNVDGDAALLDRYVELVPPR